VKLSIEQGSSGASLHTGGDGEEDGESIDLRLLDELILSTREVIEHCFSWWLIYRDLMCC
jgi:hypothetical protein